MQKLMFVLSLALTACGIDSVSSSQRAILDQDCAVDTDCPTGFECEVEVEHGTTTSFCQAHDTDASCPPGYELEVEHGQSYCKLHGGDDDQPGTGSGASCASDTDCPAGEECEVEVEHGTTTGTCQAHGGGN